MIKIETEKMLEIISDVMRDLKAQSPVILDLHGVANFTDYFVIASAEANTQRKAIADEIYKRLKDKGVLPYSKNVTSANGWIVQDYIDVVVHIMSSESRNYYNLENLWGDAKILEISHA